MGGVWRTGSEGWDDVPPLYDIWDMCLKLSTYVFTKIPTGAFFGTRFYFLLRHGRVGSLSIIFMIVGVVYRDALGETNATSMFTVFLMIVTVYLESVPPPPPLAITSSRPCFCSFPGFWYYEHALL